MSYHSGVGSLFLGAILIVATILHVHGDDSRANLTSDTTMAKEFEAVSPSK